MQAINFLCVRSPKEQLVNQIVEDSMSGTLEARRAWPLAASLEDIAEEASQIAVPTVVLAGDHDNLDSLEQHEREALSRIPGSYLEVIPDSGYMSLLDQPLALAREIRPFVESRTSSRAFQQAQNKPHEER